MEIYRRLRPGDPPTPETAINLFTNLFFNPERYDLSKVGRLKLNFKFGLEEPLDGQILTKRDILEVIRYLIDLKNGRGPIDDIDHLGNRRVRAVGELLENQYRIGLVRMERAIKERMSLQEIETLMPHDLINAKPVTAVIKEFFGSQPAVAVHGPDEPAVRGDAQAAPLGPRARRPHPRARRLRGARRAPHALRPHLPHRDAGRSEHRPHRVAVHLRPGERVRLRRDPVPQGRGRRGDRRDVAFYSALEEEKHTIAQANAEFDKKGKFVNELVSSPPRRRVRPGQARGRGPDGRVAEPAGVGGRLAHPVPRERRRQPRARWARNMQRQAVPLLRTAAPLVGTGIEAMVARDSGVTCVARRDGMVEAVDASRIVVKADVPADVCDVAQRGRHLQPAQVPALQPEHLPQPEAHRPQGRPGEEGRRHRRRSRDRDR